jgi:RsiW-degrading membrane proteinase PrsW (M82 family)
MTTKEKFDTVLSAKRQAQKKSIYFIIGSILVVNVLIFLFSGTDNKESIPAWFPVIIILCFSGPMTGLFIIFKNIQSLKKTMVCPHCRKSLSYLVTDPNYTNKYFLFQLAEEFPADVTHCPFCKFDLKFEAQDD